MGLLKTCRCRQEAAVEPSKVKRFTLRELNKATNSFSSKNLLGKGSHACVYKAVLDNGQVVAVKRPTIGRRTMQDVTSFDNELEVLCKIRHQHLVNLIGYCNEPSEKLLVVEFMGKGTLYDLVHTSAEPLSWPLRVHMAYQAAQAILALHSASPPIIHRDVKSSNILVDNKWNAKLGDLGLALRGHLEDVVQRKTPPAGTMGYIDPEYQTPSQISSKSDVFSFGILLLEIMSGRNAIDVRFNPSSIVDWAVPLIRQGKSVAICDPSLKPPQNLKAVRQLAAIAARSVRQSSSRRPTMVEVVDSLRQIRRMLPVSPFGGKPVKNPVSHYAPAHRDELSDDAMSSASSIFDEGDSSPTDSSKSEKSPGPMRSPFATADLSRVLDLNLDGLTPTSSLSRVDLDGPTPASSRTHAHPIFDPDATSPPWNNSHYVRNEKRMTIGSQTSSGDEKNNGGSCTFGSVNAVYNKTTPGLAAAQQLYFDFRVNSKNSLQPTLSPHRSPNLRTLRESVTLRDAIIHGQQSADSRKLSTNDAGPVEESRRAVGESGRGLRTPLRADTSSLQPQVRFRRDFSPWNASAMYANAASPFDKVDLPIAV